MRYAYFPDRHRLALDVGGRVSVHDTGDHWITGFSRQQSGGQSSRSPASMGSFGWTVCLRSRPSPAAASMKRPQRIGRPKQRIGHPEKVPPTGKTFSIPLRSSRSCGTRASFLTRNSLPKKPNSWRGFDQHLNRAKYVYAGSPDDLFKIAR